MKIFPTKLKRLVQRWLPAGYYRKKSYSQCGEDIIIYYILANFFGRTVPSYVDIGANHPFDKSNTALLYEKGGRGILVEPNPQLAAVLRARRPHDQVLACGVSISEATSAPYFMFDAHTLNTFSASEAARYRALGQVQTGIIDVALRNVNEILSQVGEIDFLNLDVEGLDMAILETIDWTKSRPKVLCVETIQFEVILEPKKIQGIRMFLEMHGYFVYADTFINSIFVDKKLWDAKFCNGPEAGR